MYRKLLWLFLCGRTLTAPQQDVETIADVKPTIFDYPAEVYDLPAPYPAGDTLINRPYSALYDMTTENIELDTTDYNEELTDYDKITESIPRYYESSDNSAEIYSKLGYFTHNYLPGHRKIANSNDRNQIKNDDMKYHEIHNKTDIYINSTKDNSSKIDETTNSGIKPSTVGTITEIKNVLDNSQSLENAINIKDIANIVEGTPSKPSFSNGRKDYLNEFVQKRRRKFRSNCRCERIWNCPKLQITVPRCPDEYFMCCF